MNASDISFPRYVVCVIRPQGRRIAAAIVVVHRPSLLLSALWVKWLVYSSIPLMRHSSRFSSQLFSGSNLMPMTVANISAARSSA